MLRQPHSQERKGTTVVETAVILPVFFFFLLAIIEFGHAQMVNSVLNSACRNGARVGSVEGTTTAQVLAQVNQSLESAIPTASVEVSVKDAGVYDSGSPPPTSSEGLDALPSLELADAEPRQMFLIRASVPYNEISLVPMPFMEGVVLKGQSFMRHE